MAATAETDAGAESAAGAPPSGMAASMASWGELLSRMKRPTDTKLAQIYLLSDYLHSVLAQQVAYLAICATQIQRAAASRAVKRFTRTWQERLKNFRRLSEGQAKETTDADSPPDLMLGIVGCGVIGRNVVLTLLDAGFAPSQILVSSRSPQHLKELSARGVYVAFDNQRIATSCHLLILAVLPAHLPDVRAPASHDAAQPHLAPSTLVVSTVLGVSTAKLGMQLNTDAVLHISADASVLRPKLLNSGAVSPLTLLEVSASALFADAAAAGTAKSVLGRLAGELELPDEDVEQISSVVLSGAREWESEGEDFLRRLREQFVACMTPVAAGMGAAADVQTRQ
eukprot:6201854-Pleurochrysis_carterae.AAC.3